MNEAESQALLLPPPPPPPPSPLVLVLLRRPGLPLPTAGPWSTHCMQEASMMRRLLHPNVVQFMGICVTEQRGMLLQEYCAGKDLEAGRWRAALPAGELPLAPVVWCAGGTYLRDLKPHNILLTQEWVAKIGDVGLARLFNRTRLSLGGQIGTFDYCAPEVLLGRGATPASDVFRYGVILFQKVTGTAAT
ncbi:G-type lectin S-receptor-like serine threonine-kinase [Micractinium conductrix]|uniref:G-type lectin S-receptor-like serine threonine-kinase n=1 Tax=Micractinium conductrix TaxID=554055 RepID=A0A2P6V220_9CHLO|nr:G-type lectin S-receptor-like serine threonine-kinase [Micractinium conductrix]|eukprot:PSC68135.1 G-type lectin S-receptor-like serine threonine-kinase [Micractinium conductrix]